MKITKSQLEQIIKEEIKLMSEGMGAWRHGMRDSQKNNIAELITNLGLVVKALHSAKPPNPEHKAAAYLHLVKIVENNPEKVKEHGSPEYYANELAQELESGGSPNKAFVPTLAAHLENALQGK